MVYLIEVEKRGLSFENVPMYCLLTLERYDAAVWVKVWFKVKVWVSVPVKVRLG